MIQHTEELVEITTLAVDKGLFFVHPFQLVV